MPTPKITHELKATRYEYRDHLICLVGIEWFVMDFGEGGKLFSSLSIDDCTAMIDEVCDDV